MPALLFYYDKRGVGILQDHTHCFTSGRRRGERVKKILRTGLSALLALLFIPDSAIAIEKYAFPEQKNIGGYELTLRGSGVLRYMVFIQAYEGALYLQEEKTADQVLDEKAARLLLLHYFHAIRSDDFADATTEMIRKNVSPDRFSALSPKIEEFNLLYRDIRPGDHYAAAYIPGTGTSLSLNDDLLGTIEGAEFGAAFFSIWLGGRPIDKTFRDRLLGKGGP